MNSLLRACVFATVFVLAAAAPQARQSPPLRLAIAGLVHGHVDGFLRNATGRPADVQIVGVFDPDASLRKKYADKYHLDAALFFDNLGTMLDKVRPEAVASFTTTLDHPVIVEAAAARKITVMMEKPLAVTNADAQRIKRAADRAGIQVLVNYETTWYPSHGGVWEAIKAKPSGGAIRRIVAMDGHAGPKAINVQTEFFDWLTDPARNGAGALFDFGCYGANLMTWLMDGARPVAVTAIAQRLQPSTYPRVEDEATVVVEYPSATGIIEASWNWPYGRKDLEVYSEHAWAVATGPDNLRVMLPGQPAQAVTPDPRPADERDSISHLVAVARGTRKPNALSSLDNNIIVTEILDAARESVRGHRRIELPRKP